MEKLLNKTLKRMRNLISIILLLLLFSGCQKNNLPTNDEITNAIAFVNERLIFNNTDSIYLSDCFSNKLRVNTIYNDIADTELNFSKDDLEYMKEQYVSYKGKDIVNFIKNQDRIELINLDNDSDLTTKEDRMIFEFGIPLFSCDKKEFIMYAFTTFLDSKGERRWEDLYWYFTKDEESWSLAGVIKRKE